MEAFVFSQNAKMAFNKRHIVSAFIAEHADAFGYAYGGRVDVRLDNGTTATVFRGKLDECAEFMRKNFL